VTPYTGTSWMCGTTAISYYRIRVPAIISR
jgi:hypothetical protein